MARYRVAMAGMAFMSLLLMAACTPTAPPVAPTVLGVTSGWHHSCAVLASGAVKCWGRQYELGNGATADSSSPVVVAGIDGVTGVATAVDAGLGHTCAVLKPGSVWCWGDNSTGQLGDGTTTFRSTPVETSLTAANGNQCGAFGAPCDAATRVSAGGGHTCALLRDQTIDCWGSNAFGQIGIGTFGGAVTTPTPVVGLPGPATSVSAGDYHTCAVIAGSGIWCWGRGNSGTLGNGGTSSQAVPVRVALSDTGPQPTTVSAGGNDTTCATLSDHTVWCWGFNGNGQLGDGTKIERDTPVQAVGATATALGTGWSHVCSADATSPLGLECWGLNQVGQLGNNNSSFESLTPQTLARGGNFSLIDSSPLHTCASDTSVVYCWGYNANGEIGNPAVPISGAPIPTQVLGL